MLRERDSRRSLAAEKPAIHARRSETNSANSSYTDQRCLLQIQLLLTQKVLASTACFLLRCSNVSDEVIQSAGPA